MLAYVLAWVIGLGSLGVYLAAFFFPEMHRKNDFIWSGIGFFYALVLWVYAERLRGGLLLGQTASVALLISFGWQTLKLRRQLTPLDQQTELPDTETVQTKVGGLKSNLQRRLANLPIRRAPAQPSQAAPVASPDPDQQTPSTTISQATQPQAQQPPPSPPLNQTAPRPAQAPAVESKGISAPIPVPETAREAKTSAQTEAIAKSKPQKVPQKVPQASTTPAKSSAQPAQPPLAKLQAIAAQTITTLREQVQRLLPRGKSQRSTLPGQPKSQTRAKTVKPLPPEEKAEQPTLEQSAGEVSPGSEPLPPNQLKTAESASATEVVEPKLESPPLAPEAPTGKEIPEPAPEDVARPDTVPTVAPEAELVPPAEDASVGNTEVNPEAAGPSGQASPSPEAVPSEVGPIESPESQATEENHPKLVRPNRPNPELLDAARRATEAKSSGKEPGAENPPGQVEGQGTSS